MTGILKGGAANGTKQLALSLVDERVDVSLWYPRRIAGDVDAEISAIAESLSWRSPLVDRIVSTIRFRRHRTQFKKLMRRRPRGFAIFSSDRGAAKTGWPPHGLDVTGEDILHLHWVTKTIDYESFFGSVPKTLPIVWTLHDMNPFTGGCHFSAGCRGFESGCGSCPQLAEVDRGAADVSWQYFKAKSSFVGALENLHVVAPSHWMINNAMTSPVFRNARSFHRIPYGLSSRFHQGAIPSQKAKEALGIDPEAFVFSFGATDLNDTRKGANYVVDAIQQVSDSNVDFDVPVVGLTFGSGEFPQTNIPIRSLGFLSDPESLMRVYSASDLFVLPSTEDNLPFTAIEAMCGGAALLGFDVSGIPDLIIDGVTGRLAKPGDASDLANKFIAMAIDRQGTRRMGAKAKEIAGHSHRGVQEATAYINLYSACLGDPHLAQSLSTAVKHPARVAA